MYPRSLSSVHQAGGGQQRRPLASAVERHPPDFLTELECESLRCHLSTEAGWTRESALRKSGQNRIWRAPAFQLCDGIFDAAI